MYGKAASAKTEIDRIADEIAAQVGGKVAKAPLKGRERALQKAREYEARGGGALDVKDLARNTIVVEQENYEAAVALLRQQGAKVKTIKANENPLGYSGTNAVVKTSSGIAAEIQVNTPEMIYAKEKPAIARAILGSDRYDALQARLGVPGGMGHALYEEHRALPPGDIRADVIAQESQSYYGSIRRRT